MKKIYIFILCLSLSVSLSAQNTTLAKINFEAAEEAYNNSNYELALQKLSKAEEYFGQRNLPILYLRIVSQNKLMETKADFAQLQSIKSNCKIFLEKYTSDPDAYEKIKEVYVIDETWAKYATEADFAPYLATLAVKQKKEQAVAHAMALADELKQDYLNAVKVAEPNKYGKMISFEFDFKSKTYLVASTGATAGETMMMGGGGMMGGLTGKVSLKDIANVEFKKSSIVFQYRNKKVGYWYMPTDYINAVKDKLLQLIKMLEMIE